MIEFKSNDLRDMWKLFLILQEVERLQSEIYRHIRPIQLLYFWSHLHNSFSERTLNLSLLFSVFFGYLKASLSIISRCREIIFFPYFSLRQLKKSKILANWFSSIKMQFNNFHEKKSKIIKCTWNHCWNVFLLQFSYSFHSFFPLHP